MQSIEYDTYYEDSRRSSRQQVLREKQYEQEIIVRPPRAGQL